MTARGTSTGERSMPVTDSVYYNCVCDEVISLRCANRDCGAELPPDGMMTVTPDGSVYCSDRCAALAG